MQCDFCHLVIQTEETVYEVSAGAKLLNCCSWCIPSVREQLALDAMALVGVRERRSVLPDFPLHPQDVEFLAELNVRWE